jgi:hypothetical protein
MNLVEKSNGGSDSIYELREGSREGVTWAQPRVVVRSSDQHIEQTEISLMPVNNGEVHRYIIEFGSSPRQSQACSTRG